MAETYLDIEVGGVTEDGADALCLCMHINFLDFAGLHIGVIWGTGGRVLCEGGCEGGLASLLRGRGEGCRGHVVSECYKLLLL